ncbi:hypothetical protein [Phenylobacterium sp.]|uniref:hypothetical protein n=1 Tax=Phenylobacterium sp. TaxID=1871053 RepID=UPI002CF215A7|nr:hypothetical protein [Phenylobacterium sp.]HVI34351.1 hypothetical protein [Phenylobacterium sp.]
MSDVVGTSGPDTLAGSAAAESLSGLAGDDLIRPGGGNDTVDGGAGVDVISYDNATGGVAVSLFPSPGGPQISNAEHLSGGSFGDTLTGAAGDNSLRGGAGADSLDGGFGADTLVGGAGADTLRGGEGADRFVVDGSDSAVEAPDVILDWSSDDRLALILSGAYQEASAPDAGRAYAERLIAGGAQVVAMETPAGVIVYFDSAYDGGGAESAMLLAGRTLADIDGANVGALTVLPTMPMGPAEPTPPPPPPPPPSATAGSDTLAGGDAADVVDGLGGADSLSGGAGEDTLNGGDGDDTLDGGAGADRLAGGAGADRFVVGVGQSAPVAGEFDTIADIGSSDRLVFAGGRLTGSLVAGLDARDFAEALTRANTYIGTGQANFVFVRVSSNEAYIFVDSRNDDGQADDVVRTASLEESALRSLLVGALAVVDPERPAIPGPGALNTRTTVIGNMDAAHLSGLLEAIILQADANAFVADDGAGHRIRIDGLGLDYEGPELISGQMTGLHFRTPGFEFDVRMTTPVSPAPLGGWLLYDAVGEAFATLLRGADGIAAGLGADLVRGFDGADYIEGRGGSDTIFGGAGNDRIFATAGLVSPQVNSGGSTYLRGDDGADTIFGAAGFDDINGNAGHDVAVGGDGDDWVVGGKDNDSLFGDAGADLVYGNLGDDTGVGGDGNDIVRGGQGADRLYGGAGADWVSGDRGDDTVAGGAGADIFHGSQDAGIDRVLDFSVSQGDRVQLDPGTTYTLREVGSDTIIDMGAGHQMILLNVELASLPPGWIFGA